MAKKIMQIAPQDALSMRKYSTPSLVILLLFLVSFAGIASAATFRVAASDAGAASRAAANYLCDGTADQAEIQAALTALGAAGGDVILSEGTFSITGTIQVPAHARLLGAGSASTSLRFSNNGYISILTDYVVLDGFSATGTAYHSPVSQYGLIYSFNANHLKINNIEATADNTIQGVIFINQGNDRTVQDIELNNDRVVDAGTYAFLFSSWSSTNKLIRDVRLVDCEAINAGKYSRFNDWVTGFDFAEQNDIQNLTAIRCTADGSWESGFHLEGVPTKTGLTYIDCISRNNGQDKKVQSRSTLGWGAGYLLSGQVTLQNCLSANDYIGYDINGASITLSGSSDSCSDIPIYANGRTVSSWPGITTGCGVTPTPTRTPTPTPTATPTPTPTQGGNRAPVLASIGPKSVNEGSLLTFTVSATDPDGDALTYSANSLPSGATFTAATRTFSWIPSMSQAGTYPVSFSVTDGYLSDSEVVMMTVTDVDQPPVLAAIGSKAVGEGSTLSFTVSATDADGDPLTYSTGTLPSGASFTAATRTFTWTPSSTQGGNYQVAFSVSDGLLSDSETITITVNNVNHAPVLSPVGNRTTYEGSALVYTISATDPDGDPLAYSSSPVPSGASFTPGTRTFSWTPTYTQAGKYWVNYTVTDGSLRATENTTITVINTNRPPVLSPIGGKTVSEGSNLAFTVSGSDPDGDSLTYFTGVLPSGSSFTPATRTFSWTPAYGQAGSYQVIFAVSDGVLSTSETITITVTEVNQAPVLATIGAKSVDELATLSFTVSATDPDGDSLAYSTGSLPSGASFTPATRTFAWTPTYKTAGNYQVSFSVSDGKATDSENVPISVKHVNHPPSQPHIGPKNVKEGSTLSFSIGSTDPDGDTITYSATPLPSGSSFNTATGAFTWTPAYYQSGTYPVTFATSDGLLVQSELVQITVEDYVAPTTTPTPGICIGPCPSPEPTSSVTPTPTQTVSQTPTPASTPTPSPTSTLPPGTPAPSPSTTPTPSATPSSGPQESQQPSVPASKTTDPAYSGAVPVEDPLWALDPSLVTDPSADLDLQPGQPGSDQFGSSLASPGTGRQGAPGSTGSSSLASGTSGTGTGVDGTGSSGTAGGSAGSGNPSDIFPSFGVHSALVFGSTVTVSSIVRRKEGRREFDRLMHYLLTGVALFTIGTVACLLGTIL